MDIIKKLVITLSACFFVCTFIACDENDGPADNTTSRLFRPAAFGIDANASIGNEIVLTWMPVSNATYLLEISASETFEENAPLWSIPLGNVSRYMVTFEEVAEHLGYQANIYYGVRIKSISNSPNIKDSEYATTRFRFVSP